MIYEPDESTAAELAAEDRRRRRIRQQRDRHPDPRDPDHPGDDEPKPLKAYEVRDDYEGYCTIVFATNSATARREGASDLDTEWESIESCLRKPEFDRYAPGPVPKQVLVAHGWWFECHHCGRRISQDMYESLESDGLDPDDFEIQYEGSAVYCSAACAAIEAARRRGKAAAESALLELFETKFPGAVAKRVHVCNERLEASEPHGGLRCTVEFTFPGAKYGATFVYGWDDVLVAQIDAPAFIALYRGRGAEQDKEAA